MPDLLQDRVVAAIGDRYDVEGELGRGGMAVVYRARDVRLRRPVALKVLPPDLAFREGVRARFLREAETAAQLSHPHVVPIYAADETNGVAWLAMALVEGETLGARMTRAPRLPVEETRRILAEVAGALAYAHARGVVHRDIKPDNILLDRDSGHALVTDFGIARAAEADTRLTLTGIAVGTPTYMSPEQALGERELDGRSDLYSLAVVGYQMLAGAPPFTATSAAALLMKHVGERPVPIAHLRPDVPLGLAAAIDRALAKKPEDRWADAAEFQRALLAAAPMAAVPAVPSRAVAPPQSVPRPPRPAAPEPTAPLEWRAHRDAAQEQIDNAREQIERARDQLREQRRAWRERHRDQRDAVRDAVKGYANANWSVARSAMPMQPLPLPESALAQPWQGGVERGYPPVALDQRAEWFRRKVIRSVALLAFLTCVNLVTIAASQVPFPWVMFPAIGIIRGLRRRWRPLAREGLSFSEVMFGGGEQAVAASARAHDTGRAERLVRRLQRRVTTFIIGVVGAVVSFIIGASLHAEPMLVPFAGFMILAGLSALSFGVTAIRVRRTGISVRDALGSSWRDALAAADRRPREVILSEQVARLASAEVLGGPYARAVRGAVDDRLTVRETLAKLSPADRALLPDVMPTIDALVQRVAELAQSLHRLDGDISPSQLPQIEARLRAVEAEPATAPDRERKLQLLRRQRASIVELSSKRETLAAQMESAQLVLQNLKLDLIKLRSKGVGAAIGEVSTATQEARVLSRDIAHALEAAAEVRGL
ncbi:serine/threonine-protein kinase [Gemmatirosa kalamazoonensis]|nr:serine/threonine-protein kinase [Gemmatirosa kalamazoonensis]